MIKYNPKIWFRHIFQIRKGDTLFIIWKEMLLIALFTIFLAWVKITYFKDFIHLKDLMGVYSLVGFVLSLLLVFRTNTAYDRWWEGRKRWGQLVNNTRNLAIKISSMSTSKDTEAFFSRMIPNYAFAMKEHLRSGVILDELELTPEERTFLESKSHEPSFIAKWMYERLDQMKKDGDLTQEEFLSMDTNLKTFSDIIGACERIKNTPLPYSYSNFMKKFIFIYVITMPLAFVDSFSYFSALVSSFVFYVLVSMEILAEEIEDPFGDDPNDLPTDELSQKIRDNVQELLKD
ncbi:MAG: putative membrane protein [Arenicella sp.]|jgi:putative membrane protein